MRHFNQRQVHRFTGPQARWKEGRSEASEALSWGGVHGGCAPAHSLPAPHPQAEGLQHPQNGTVFQKQTKRTCADLAVCSTLKTPSFISFSELDDRILISPKLYWAKPRLSTLLRATPTINGKVRISKLVLQLPCLCSAHRTHPQKKLHRPFVPWPLQRGMPAGHRKGGFCS